MGPSSYYSHSFVDPPEDVGVVKALLWWDDQIMQGQILANGHTPEVCSQEPHEIGTAEAIHVGSAQDRAFA